MIENAYSEVCKLIKTFEENYTYYLSPNYSEAEVRQDFIDKFFTALGWDVAHNFQKNPFQQEVKVEKTQKQEGATAQKRADYAFYLAPEFRIPKFFVEAKKPSRTLRQNKQDYFQTAKYGWNAGTGVSILTDFEELVIIDCRFRPDIETILSCEIAYYRYQDFLDKEIFAKIYWLFSKEALEAGNLATYIDELPNAQTKARQLSFLSGAYQAIDDSFLGYIDDIRLQLAKAFFAQNPNLTNDELTEATQRTIDRLVLMRFLEDKQIEPITILYEIANHQHSWQKFISESKRLDTKYNGIIFKPHFIDNSDFLGANEDLFKDIATDFDHTNSPYDFNYIPIYVLGNIYERFLGKVIEIHDNKVSIEEKPSVRKAGGVFYTPKYIVDYIVKHSVGDIIEGKSLNAISNIKIADISCGSGSFLIGVYEYLLNYYKSYYNKFPSVAEDHKCIFDKETGQYILSIRQKQEILTRHIYGVDIDLQAIEVTQLSLFLKLLEDETMATVHQLDVLFSDKILPDLTQNIKCGNALVDYDIIEKVDGEVLLKINPFNYQSAFPKVFDNTENSGFDIIVGNPPYIKEYTDRTPFEWVKQSKLAPYYIGKMDLWYFFVCYGLDLLKENGKLGFIVPNNWVSNAGASILRNKVLADARIERLIDFSGFMVFKDASIQTMIMLMSKNGKPNRYSFFYQAIDSKKSLTHELVYNALSNADNAYSQSLTPKIDRIEMQNKFLKFNTGDIDGILDKMALAKNFILNNKEVAQGIVGAPDKYFLVEKTKINEFNDNEKVFLKPFYTTAKRYVLSGFDNYIFYISKKNFENKKLSDYPNILNHFEPHKDNLMQAKIKYKTPDKPYFYLHRERDEKFFSLGDKIISPTRVFEPQFFYTNNEYYSSRATNIIKTDRINLKYLAGILNSKLIYFWLKNRGKKLGDMLQIDKEPLLQIPLIKTDDKSSMNKMIESVDKIIAAYQKLAKAISDKEKNLYQNQITVLEKTINELVYEIYEINQDEVAIIESSL